MEALGGLLALAGLAGLVVSVISLIRPIAKIGLGTRKRAALGLLGSFVILIISGSLLPSAEGAGTANASSKAKPVATPSPPSTTAIGQVIQVGDAAITIEKVETRKRVGVQYASENASEGGVMVVVHTSIKNTGTKPLKTFSVPQIELIDPAGTEYSIDVGRTAAYSMERGDLDAKAWSDLNPGITVRDAKVFEVSAEQYNPETWLVTVGGKRNKVAMK